jgi:hypothetical protein
VDYGESMEQMCFLRFLTVIIEGEVCIEILAIKTFPSDGFQKISLSGALNLSTTKTMYSER